MAGDAARGENDFDLALRASGARAAVDGLCWVVALHDVGGLCSWGAKKKKSEIIQQCVEAERNPWKSANHTHADKEKNRGREY